MSLRTLVRDAFLAPCARKTKILVKYFSDPTTNGGAPPTTKGDTHHHKARDSTLNINIGPCLTKKRRENSPCPIVNQNELFETKTNIPNFCGTVPLMQQVGKMVLSVVARSEWTKVARDEVKRAL